MKRFLLATILLAGLLTDVFAGSLTLLGVGGAGGSGQPGPSWVATTCPGTSGQNPSICIDFANNRAWDGIAGTTVTPASLLSVTNAAPPNYSTNTEVSTISANTPSNGTVYPSAGLQVQGGGTNLLLQSNTFTTSPWSKNAVILPALTLTANAATSPDGTANAWQTTFGANTSTNQQQEMQQGFATTAGNTYTCSIWIKAASSSPPVSTYIILQHNASPFEFLGTTLVQPTTTWARYSVSGIALATSPSIGMYFSVGSSTETSITPYLPFTLGGSINFYGSQCNTGPVALPYVATTSSTATSTADQIAAAGDFKRALAVSNGSIVVRTNDALQSDPFQSGHQATSALLSDGSSSVLAIGTANKVSAWATSSLTSSTSSTWNKPETVSLAWNGSTSGVLNLNGTASTDTGNSRSIACSSNCYVGSTGGSSNFLNGHIASIGVYPASITPATSVSPITSISFNTPGVVHYNSSSSTMNGDELSNTIEGGQYYSMADDVQACNSVAFSANAGFNEWVNSSGGAWIPGTAPDHCLGVQTFAGSYNMGAFNTVNSSDSYRTWKSWGMSGIGGNFYAMYARQNYGTASNGYTNCTAYYTGGACQLNVQYSYYATLISAPASGISGSTTWSGSFPTTANGPSPAPMFSDANLGTGCVSPGGGCGHYFSFPEIVKYAPDQSAAATYGSSSTNVCAGGVASGCPDGSGTYAYAISNDGAWDVGNSLQLGRVPLANIGSLSISNWQVWDKNNTGCTNVIMDNNCWVAMSSMASATPILGTMAPQPTTTGVYGNPSVQWFPAAGQYMMISWYYPTLANTTNFGANQTGQTMWQIWTATSLIGPWTMVQQYEWKGFCSGTGGSFGTSGAQCGSGSAGGPFGTAYGAGFYSPAFVQGAIVNGSSTDGGRTGAIMVGGNFQESPPLYGPNWIPFAVNY